MFTYDSNFFGTRATISPTAKVVVVADMFAEDYVGGAELTTQAIIDSSPFQIHKIRSRELTMDLIKQGIDRFWIFGNFADINPQLIPTIVTNLKYSVMEYDYKYCKMRSPEKHAEASGMPCSCHNDVSGKLISAFYYGSMGLWWMSEKQKERYMTLFPFLADKTNVVLSSVFSDQTLASLKLLRAAAPAERKNWIVLGSNSWVKGFSAAEKWCKDNNLPYEIVWNLPYDELLAKLSVSEGFVYLPAGADTCPRMVIEAKLLGCKLQLNDFVQHKDEEWFTAPIPDIEEYLYASKKLFWNGIKEMMEYRPKISGYTTTFNCIQQEYPFTECIKSMLQFCDEVCVVDGGSKDGTWEKLVELAYPDMIYKLNVKEQIEFVEDLRIMGGSPHEHALDKTKIKLKEVQRNWKNPRFAVFDGMQKAEARKMCTGDFCWQMDSDEIVHENDAPKIADLCKLIPKEVDILSLPVLEYWGGPEKVRVDIQPWKWRLSRNKPSITHGIPMGLRRTDEQGNTYALEGTDGCDMIDVNTGNPLPHVSFYSQEAENARQAALQGNAQALREYENWFNEVTNNLPGVFHYSWYDLPRKIRLYRDYWSAHWFSLYNKKIEDVPENNMMFDVAWKDVTDEMLLARAQEMKEKLGGWIWHRKWDGKTMTPFISTNRTQPKLMTKEPK
jgi:glycosyltransferase involved in cell wall biosynthesis